MLKTVAGLYKDGQIELFECPPEVGESRVLVTFLAAEGLIDLPARGVSTAAAADLRARLRTFADDWDRPDMDVYDVT